jgi:AraC-like DNA-binding protein
MMLIQDIRYSRFNKVVTTYYRQKKCMLLLEHFLSLMINSEPEKNKLELTSQQVITLDYIKEFIKQHIHQKLTVKILRKQFHVNSNLLEKGFRQINMISVEDFIHLWRMESATKYLAHTDMAMNKIPQLTGFRSYTDFVTAFKQYFNCEPELFRYPAHQQ